VKADIKSRWTAELRSGRFVQGTGALKTEDDTYCCLGVLCQLAIEDGVDIRVTEPKGAVPHYEYDGEGGLLPESVYEWAGLEGPSPYISELNDGLTGLNDGGDHDFNSIASIIDQYV
jgi:hypothetical protein